MAKSAEDFAAELLIPIAAIAAVIFFIQKILEWIWKLVVPYAVPVLWGVGVLSSLGVVFFIIFARAGMVRYALKSFVFMLGCLGIFGVVVYCGNTDRLPWAQAIVDSMRCILEHPIISCAIVGAFLVLAVVIPIPGLGPVWLNKAKREFLRGVEDGMNDETLANVDGSVSSQEKN